MQAALSLAGQVSSLLLVAGLFLYFVCAAELEKKTSSFKIEIMAGACGAGFCQAASARCLALGNGVVICMHYSKARLERELPRKVLLQGGLMSSSL